MESLFQPMHLAFVMVIVLIIFGPGKPPDLKNLGRGLQEIWRKPDKMHGGLFMAKGVDPAVGRDLGDTLPDEDGRRLSDWVLFVLLMLVSAAIGYGLARLLPR